MTIDDAAENAWVQETFVTVPGRNIGLWLGLTGQAVEGTFAWTRGAPVVSTNRLAGSRRAARHDRDARADRRSGAPRA